MTAVSPVLMHCRYCSLALSHHVLLGQKELNQAGSESIPVHGLHRNRQVYMLTLLCHHCRHQSTELCHCEKISMTFTWKPMGCPPAYPNGPEAGREAGWGSEFVPLKKRQAGSFILLHKISRTACCFGIRTFLKQYSCYESATNWYTDHQYLAQYSDIINNLQEIPLIFCNYAVRSCGTWRKGPGQSPCNGLSISDLELYVTERARVFVTPSQIKMWYACVNHCK